MFRFGTSYLEKNDFLVIKFKNILICLVNIVLIVIYRSLLFSSIYCYLLSDEL